MNLPILEFLFQCYFLYKRHTHFSTLSVYTVIFNPIIITWYTLYTTINCTPFYDRLVVFHDDTLNRVCKKSGTIEDLTVPELKTCRLQDTEEQIPLFEDVLSLVNGQVPLLIELKIPGRSTAICQHVHKALSCYYGNYMIQSFNTMGLFWYRRHAPEVLRGQLSSRLTKDPLKELWFLRFLAENLLLNFLGRPDFISYKLKNLPKFTVSFLRKFFGTPTAVWTLRTPEALLEGKRCYDMQIFEKHGENY